MLLATGASDVEPTMPHVAEALRNGALRYCPVCDGFEVVGQEVGVIADGPAGVREALYLRDFTDQLTVFLQPGARAISDDEHLRMHEAGIRWVDAPIEASLINVARGPVIDTPAVLAALREGRLGGAALDVHDRQPLSGDEPLFDAPRLLLTPHVAGVTATSMEGMSRGAVETMLALLRGERPPNVVNPEVFR